ncbi:MAG: Fe-S cluster assembly protein SufB [Alphaproteobacteria bacterium]|nr:Fe-S cluster assembly protein SufB [Alphaproteobacteria bacterium]
MLNKDTIISISKKRNEPGWLLDWRLAAYEAWKKMPEPHWAEIDYAPIDYDSLSYYKEPGTAPVRDNSDLKKIYEKMKLPIAEQNALLGMATDVVIDSRSVHTSYTVELERLGIIFLPFSEAVECHPELIKKYLGSVVPPGDNFFAALNAAVFSDGTFVFVPRDTKCPIDLASYFRIETAHIGQFERTLIIAEPGAELSYLEGCSAPRRPNHQLHSGVVEVIVQDNAIVKYATVQNWYAGEYSSSTRKQTGGIYNFVTKRGRVGAAAQLLWTQVEVGSAATWKYPSSILAGDYAHSDFYSLSITRGGQQADTGTKMIHVGNNTTSNIVSYGVALEESRQTFRSLVHFGANTTGAKNATNCDSKIIGDRAVINTFPTIFHGNGKNDQSHEASTGAVPADALAFLAFAGIPADEATALIIGGAAAPVLKRLPMEFLVESKQLIQMALAQE